MISLYCSPGSPHSAAVRIALAEKGIEHEERRLELARFEQHAPSYLELNSQGTVPVLEDGGRRLTESFLILLYLDELYPDPPLGGSGPRERYLVQKWGKYLETSIAPHLAIARWAALSGRVPARARGGLAGLPEERRALWQRAGQGFDAAQLAASGRALLIAGQRLAADLAERDWLVGDGFTLADAAVFPHLAQFDAVGIPTPPVVDRWIARVAGRASVGPIAADMVPLAVMGPEAGRWG